MEREKVLVSAEETARQKEYMDKVRALHERRTTKPLAYVHTYGCQQNEADSERLRGYLARMGYAFSDTEEGADLVLLNTCAVRTVEQYGTYKSYTFMVEKLGFTTLTQADSQQSGNMGLGGYEYGVTTEEMAAAYGAFVNDGVFTYGRTYSYVKDSSGEIVLENPDSISRVVLEKGLDAGTAFEILSIDIADIDVGKNIGAQLQMDQAQADKNIAQAKAEERRAMAVALEQENKAKAQDARAKVILAEAEVPLAMAEAFRNGNLGIMDYYKMKNIMADTQMRETIAKPEKK